MRHFRRIPPSEKSSPEEDFTAERIRSKLLFVNTRMALQRQQRESTP